MTTTMPDIPDAGRFNVTQASQLLGINRTTLRRYTEAGLIRCGFRRTNFKKFYTGQELKRFWGAQL